MGILYWDVNSIHLSRRLTDSGPEKEKSERSVRTSIYAQSGLNRLSFGNIKTVFFLFYHER